MVKLDVLEEKVSNHSRILSELQAEFRDLKKWLMSMVGTTTGILLVELVRLIFNR